MKLMKIKRNCIVSVIMLLFMVVISHNAFAFEKDDVQDIKVDKDKVWTIKFNKEVMYDDRAIKSIKVEDELGYKVNIRLKVSEDEKSILVQPPVRGYTEGESYTLKVDRNIYSLGNKRVKSGKEINFTIKNHEPYKGALKVEPNESLNSEKNKQYIFTRVDKMQGLNGENLIESGWKGKMYKSNKMNTINQLIYSKEDSKKIKLPLKLKGWMGVYVGFTTNTDKFKVKYKNNEKIVTKYEDYSFDDKSIYINEAFAFAANFQDDTIEIEPIEGKAAEITYIKLVSLDKAQVDLYNSKEFSRKYSTVMYDNDGYTDFFWGRYPDVESFEEMPMNLYQKTGAGEINWTLGTTGLLNYNSQYAGKAFEGADKYDSYVRQGDKIARAQILNILSYGKSPLEIVADKSDGLMKVNASLRMNAFYTSLATEFLNGSMYHDYEDCLQKDSFRLSYYYPKYRQYILNVLKEASSFEGVDGITLDFCRYPNVIGDEATLDEKIGIMNSFMRDVRRNIPDEKITVRFPYINPISYGLDIKKWVDERLVDRIIPSAISYEEFYEFENYINLVKNTGIELYIGITANVQGRDLTPETEKKLEEQGIYTGRHRYLTVEEYLYRANDAYTNGANGIFIFNMLNNFDIRKDLSYKYKLLGNKYSVKKWYQFEYPSYTVNYKIDWLH